jgi:hypothetical protein
MIRAHGLASRAGAGVGPRHLFLNYTNDLEANHSLSPPAGTQAQAIKTDPSHRMLIGCSINTRQHPSPRPLPALTLPVGRQQPDDGGNIRRTTLISLGFLSLLLPSPIATHVLQCGIA